MTSIKYKNNYNLFLIFKILLYGVFFSEFYLINKIFQTHFFKLSLTKQYSLTLFNMEFLILIMPSIYIIFILFKYLDKIIIIIKSYRIDLLVILILGIILNLVFNGIYIDFFTKKIMKLNQFQMLVIYLVPIIIIISSFIKKIQFRLTSNEFKVSSFLSDQPIKDKESDRFDFNKKAKKFADQIYNNGSSESLVFGLDAPWGTGKSSFLNLCEKHWNEGNNQVILYKFNALKYPKQNDLLEKFLEGLGITIKNHFFIPEIETLTSKYAKLLKSSNMSLGLSKINFKYIFETESMNNIFEQLKYSLSNIDKKIIIIIDDLDRLDFKSIKDILYAIKKSFSLPNISYILCYDIENIMLSKNRDYDAEKINEFLEKFINLKMSLYIDSELLFKYFTELKEQNTNLLANKGLLSLAQEGLKEIFKSTDFHHYQSFIGDARKLKRLLNLILLLDIEKTDFQNSDLIKEDLINLLLIYINYPNIFRKIYITETKGKSGFFSCAPKKSLNYQRWGKYENSEDYTKFISDLTPNQKFILNQIFDFSKRKITIDERALRSYACFNGEYKNLEKYLNLIVNTKYPVKEEEYKYYVKLKDQIISGENINEIFLNLENEKTNSNLWKVLMNIDKKGLKVEKTKQIITYALKTIPQYSLIEVEGITEKFRKYLVFYIGKLLDEVGWTDDAGKHTYDNTANNIIKISYWIFGEKEYANNGILDALTREDRGILGFYDLLSFRLVCSRNRSGETFNLYSSLSNHYNMEAPIEGSVKDIEKNEMREISQQVFKIFESQYIKAEINIFDEINRLTLENIMGKYSSNVNSKINIGNKVKILKSGIKSFICYQLASKSDSFGICCGYYDINGEEDKSGIALKINEYLFNICFNPKKNINNYRHFLDYLLISLSSNFGNALGGYEYIFDINQIIEVLDKDRLVTYWKENKEEIKSKMYIEREIKIFTSNYTATYKNDLKDIFKKLDDFIK